MGFECGYAPCLAEFYPGQWPARNRSWRGFPRLSLPNGPQHDPGFLVEWTEEEDCEGSHPTSVWSSSQVGQALRA